MEEAFNPKSFKVALEDAMGEDWERYVAEVDSDPQVICDSTNEGLYGDNCVVASQSKKKFALVC